MLDKAKIMKSLQAASKDLFVGFAQEIDIIREIWFKISIQSDFIAIINQKQQEFLVPSWQGLLSPVVMILPIAQPYTVLSVDGSQIYYDKHQGPPCFLINIGFMRLSYGLPGQAVLHGSNPILYTQLSQENDFGSPDFVNMQREAYEFDEALRQMTLCKDHFPNNLTVTLFDGSLIFFHLDAGDMERKDYFVSYYCKILDSFYEQNMLIAGYMSLPKSKELVNLCKIAVTLQGDDSNDQNFDRLTDVDIAELYLVPGSRSIIFKSKAPICYLYPKHLQPYFCYLHVGAEIVRIEFPAWIGQDDTLVNQVCSVALDQAGKGKGYPVVLFEAHEQAVIKSADRSFFYAMVERLSHNQSKLYAISQKSLKKLKPLL